MSQTTALGLTLLFEAIAVLLWHGRMGGRPGPLRLLVVAVCASLLTHPFAWWANGALMGSLAMWPRIAVVEGAVIGAEAVVYRALAPLPWGRAIGLSAWANGVSFGLGWLALRLMRG